MSIFRSFGRKSSAQQASINAEQQAAESAQRGTKEIEDLYRDILKREPDAEGLENYKRIFGDSVSFEERNAFIEAARPEAAQRGITLPEPHEVEKLYRDILKREPDPEGLENYKRIFGDSVSFEERNAFIEAARPEAAQRGITLPNPDTVEELYRGILKREPDAEGLENYKRIFGDFVSSTERNAFIEGARSEAAQRGITLPEPVNVVDRLTSQILNQGTTSQWSGEGFGSAEANARAMAERLISIEIERLEDFGVRTEKVNRPAGGTDEYGAYDIIEVDENVYYNKKTGQVLNPEYDYAGGNVWGGTFAGKGRTSFGVHFADNGTPYFYTQYGGSSSDWGKIAPLVGIGLMFVPGLQGVGAAIGAAIAPSVTVATQALIGNAIVQGALAEAQGGDFVKAAALSAVGSAAGSFAGDLGKTLGVTDPALAKVVGGAVITGSASAATGGDFLTGAVSGALSAGAGQIAGEAVGLDGRIASTVGTSIVKGVVAELQGKDVTDAMIAGAISGALTYKEQPKPEDSGITNRVVDEAIPQGYVPPIEDFDVSQIGAGANVKPDYSLTSGITFPRTDGLKVDPVTGAGATVGVSPVDYSLNVNAPFDGLKMPTSPNITGMGGGQGITVKTPEGVLSESGVTKTGTASDLGDPDSFINKPAPDVPKKAPIDPRDALKLATRIIGLAGTGAVVNEITSGTSRRPVNLEYGDIYRDAPIKGFAMRKGADGRYTPFIGEKAQLAKGGLASRRT